jgi:hypothetical protein
MNNQDNKSPRQPTKETVTCYEIQPDTWRTATGSLGFEQAPPYSGRYASTNKTLSCSCICHTSEGRDIMHFMGCCDRAYEQKDKRYS